MDVGNQIIDNLKALLDTLKGTDQPLAEVYDTPNLTSTKYPYCFINDSGIDSDFQDQQLNERMYAFKVWVFNEYDVDNPRTSRRALRSAVDAILNKIDQQESPDSAREIAYGLANLYTVMAVMATLGEAMYDEEQKVIGQLITIRIKVTVDITSALIEGPSGIVDPGHAYIADAADYYTRTETDVILDSYYTSSQVDTLLSGKSNVGHTHDDRYYTEAEIGTILAGYAPALGADENYVTDAQLAVLANTSGTNTGDNATNSQYSGLDAAKANVTLNNLASVAINTSLISDTDSTDNIGDPTKYWANTYTDKIYLNSTASLDGSVAGKIGIGTSAPPFRLTVTDGSAPDASGTIITDAAKASTISIQGNGQAYFHGRDVTNNIEFIMGSSSLGTAFAGSFTNHAFQLRANGSTKVTINTDGTVAFAGALITLSNANLSIVPNGTGYTIIGDAGTTSHSFNTNDDLLVSGRLEVDGISYFDNNVNIAGIVDINNFGTLVTNLGAVLTIASNANNASGVQMANLNTGTSADFRFVVTDSDKDQYLAFAMPGKNNNVAAIFGQARNSAGFIFINSVGSNPDRNLVIGTLHDTSLMLGTNGVVNLTIANTGLITVGNSITSDTDSTDDLGTSSIYFANGYIDKLYLNSTATIDGTVAGVVTVTGSANVSGAYQVDGTQVVSNRVVDARIDDTPNSGDATTDGIIAALQSIIQTHGLGAAA